MELMIKGFILGFIIVLPGMSGGTVFVILGMYEKLIKDLSRLYLKPYIPLLIGALVGIFSGAAIFSVLFRYSRDEAVAFLMGCLLASIKAIIKPCKKAKTKEYFVFFLGAVIGYYLSNDTIGEIMKMEETSWSLLIIAGAFASSTMMIPGIPGSSVLIILGIYDNILYYVTKLNIDKLMFFSLGAIIGIGVLVRILEKMYNKYRNALSYCFAGLILGSSRALLPNQINIIVIVVFLIGFMVTWKWIE